MGVSSVSISEPDYARTRTIIAAVLTISLVGMGLSLMIPLLSLELERMGASSSLNGIHTALGGVANIVIAPLIPMLAARLGQRQLLALMIAVLVVSIILFALFPSITAWFFIRFGFGMAIGSMFVMSEFWITASAPEARRGLVMGIYSTVLASGFAAGPTVLALTGTTGWPPYLACAGLMLAAVAPLMIAPKALPEIGGTPHTRIFPLIRIAPVATIAALMFGALETGGFSLFPVYGLRLGLEERTAALLVTYAALGNLVFQIPIGWLSDHADRRFVLLGCASLGAAGAAALPFVDPGSAGFIALLIIWGGITGAIYTVGLAHLGSRFSGAEVAVANAVFVMLYSAGMIAGPPLIGVAMDFLGANGLPVGLSAMLLAYAGLIVVRIVKTR